METLDPKDIVILLLALGLLLATARLLGEIALYIRLPSVFGEILAGILLGPTVLGALAPEISLSLFPRSGISALLLDGIITLAIVLFLLVAGLEANISTMKRQGKTVATIGLSGIIFPSLIGFGMAWYFPSLLGYQPGADPLIFALFIATALSISALPVIAKTLMDLDLYRSDLGMMIVAAAIFNDLIGWITFAVILGLMGSGVPNSFSLFWTISLTFGFTIFMLTVFRRLFDRILPWIQIHTSWPGGQLGLIMSLTLLGAAFTEWIGVHAIFGSFIVGIAMGDTPHFRERLRGVIDQFISFFFAPLFFASIGLKLNFAASFDPLLVLIVLFIACLGKVFGCSLGARLGGLSQRESWAIGVGMNARGAMEIILGLLALRFQLISEKLFVALVFMAIFTSLISGPLMQKILRLKKPRRFIDFVPLKGFIRLSTNNSETAILELVETIGFVNGLNQEEIAAAVMKREQLMPTGIGNEVAVPHARMKGISHPVVAVGIAQEGIDFKCPDGKPARLIFLILTPIDDNGAQVEILADIARTFRSDDFRKATISAEGITEFLAMVKCTEKN
jgi:Kef-type K+ transport system membrane component KefB/mannitol/fructose-specific phosphotransferase system IIA component (Ntr-type)